MVAHLFHIQRALNQGRVDREWLSTAFRRELGGWKDFALKAASRPTHLVEIVHREPTHLGFCYMYGVGLEGLWIDPDGTGHTLRAFKSGSHSRFQYRMQSCIQSCVGVKKIF